MSNWPEDQNPGYGSSGQQDAWGSGTSGPARDRVQPPPTADQPQADYQPYNYAQSPGALGYPAPQMPYAGGQPGYAAARSSGSGMAVASLVLGITSIIFCWWGVFSFLQVVLAIVFGCIALNQPDRGGDRRVMAIAGIICAGAGFFCYLIFGLLSFGFGLLI